MDLEKKVEAMLDDVAFQEKFVSIDSEQSMLKFFDEYGITLANEITPAEAYSTITRIKNGELSEDELSLVSGGGAVTAAIIVKGTITAGAVLGTGAVVVGALGLIALGSYIYYKRRK